MASRKPPCTFSESFDKWVYINVATDAEGLTSPIFRGWMLHLLLGLIRVLMSQMGKGFLSGRPSYDPSCLMAIFSTQAIPAGPLPLLFNRETLVSPSEILGWSLGVLWWPLGFLIRLQSRYSHLNAWLGPEDLLPRWCTHTPGLVLVAGGRPLFSVTWAFYIAASVFSDMAVGFARESDVRSNSEAEMLCIFWYFINSSCPIGTLISPIQCGDGGVI